MQLSKEFLINLIKNYNGKHIDISALENASFEQIIAVIQNLFPQLAHALQAYTNVPDVEVNLDAFLKFAEEEFNIDNDTELLRSDILLDNLNDIEPATGNESNDSEAFNKAPDSIIIDPNTLNNNVDNASNSKNAGQKSAYYDEVSSNQPTDDLNRPADINIISNQQESSDNTITENAPINPPPINPPISNPDNSVQNESHHAEYLEYVNDASQLQGLEDPTLAMGLGEVRNYKPNMPFIDLARSFKPWFSDDLKNDEFLEAAVTDEHGYIMEMPDGYTELNTQLSWSSNDDQAEYRAGEYILTYEGSADLEVIGVGVVINEDKSTEGRIVFENTNGGQVRLEITGITPENYIHDISLIKAEHQELFEAGAVFNPDWIDVVKDLRQVRFMDWADTNNNADLVTTEDRSLTTDFTWDGKDIPVELMVQLANEIGSDPWFNIPHQASDEYIRFVAEYIHENLDPGLQASIEFSNEVWNFSFSQTKELRAEATEYFGDQGGNTYYSYLAMKMTNVANIFNEVFGDESESRLVHVLPTQGPNINVTNQLLDPHVWREAYENDPQNIPEYKDPTDVFDVLASTTYFGGSILGNVENTALLIEAINNPEVDANEYLFNMLLNPEIGQSLANLMEGAWASQINLAHDAGLQYVAYEGGQHMHYNAASKHHLRDEFGEKLRDENGRPIVDPDYYVAEEFIINFIRSEYMADLYEILWEYWEANADGPFMHFVELSNIGKTGSWGIRTSYDDETPRSEMLDRLNSETNNWWGDTRDAFQHGLNLAADDADNVLLGTSEEDILIARAGDDLLVGGFGDDKLHGGDGYDTILLSGERDDYTFTQVGEQYVAEGLDGIDLLTSIEFAEFENGDVFDIAQNVLAINRDATAGNDAIFGTDEADTLNGGAGRDYLTAGAGDDSITFDSTDIYVGGGAGNDTAALTAGDAGEISAAAQRISGIETLDLTNGAANRIILDEALLSQSETDTLTILGDDTDVLVTNMDLTLLGSNTVEGVTYSEYQVTGSDTRLLLDQDITIDATPIV